MDTMILIYSLREYFKSLPDLPKTLAKSLLAFIHKDPEIFSISSIRAIIRFRAGEVKGYSWSEILIISKLINGTVSEEAIEEALSDLINCALDYYSEKKNDSAQLQPTELPVS